MKIKSIMIGIVLALFVSTFLAQTEKNRNPGESITQTKWIAESLKRMQRLKVGMTRADLLKVFTTEGGLSNGLQRTYVYRECPYIKVDVEFEPVGRPARDGDGRVPVIEANEDVIKKISKPYLEWSIAD